jgi:hypothetical protein
MPGFVPGNHVFLAASKQEVDGRDKPGHDGAACQPLVRRQPARAMAAPAKKTKPGAWPGFAAVCLA